MEILSIREIIIVLISTIFLSVFIKIDKNFDDKYQCFKPKNRKLFFSIWIGLFLGVLIASIINRFVDGKEYIPYHDNTINIIFDAFKYLLFSSPIVFIVLYLTSDNKCDISLKRNIALRKTFVFLLSFIILLPILMARINIKYDESKPKTQIVTIFDKHKITASKSGDYCSLSIGSSFKKRTSIKLDVGFCDKIEKWQKLKLEYRKGFLGYKWISNIKYSSKNANKS